MKKLTVILLALMLVFTFAACGGGGGGESADPNAGIYTLTSASMSGISLSPEELYTGESYVELKDNGKCTVCLDDESVSGKWILEGTDLTITTEDVDSYGTLQDSVIVVDLFEMGMDFTFEKTE